MPKLNYDIPKQRGLTNSGNTCYMNACLQILAHTFELNEIVVNANPKASGTEFLQKWAKIVTNMWTIGEGDIVEDTGQLKELDPSSEMECGLDKGNQHDFSEYFLIFIHKIHDALVSPVSIEIKGMNTVFTNEITEIDTKTDFCYQQIYQSENYKYSDIKKLLFFIQYRSTDNGVTPSENLIIHLQARNNNPAGDSNTTPGGGTTLVKSFEQYIQDDQLLNLPPILVIQLMRIDADGQKITDMVEYPIHSLDLSNYVVGYKKSYIYDLYGVAIHTESEEGGHYISYVFNYVTGNWFLCNDADCTLVTDLSQIVSKDAYCLFYRRRT